MREVDEKAVRLLREGRVTRNERDACYRVLGFSGKLYVVLVGTWGGTCTCQAGEHSGQLKLSEVVDRGCSHLLAALVLAHHELPEVREAVNAE